MRFDKISRSLCIDALINPIEFLIGSHLLQRLVYLVTLSKEGKHRKEHQPSVNQICNYQKTRYAASFTTVVFLAEGAHCHNYQEEEEGGSGADS